MVKIIDFSKIQIFINSYLYFLTKLSLHLFKLVLQAFLSLLTNCLSFLSFHRIVVLNVDVEHQLSLQFLRVIVEVSVISISVPELIHRVHVLPSVLILEERVVVSVAVWSRLITVNLPLLEKRGIVVAIFAVLHLLIGVESWNRIRFHQHCPVFSFLIIG